MKINLGCGNEILSDFVNIDLAVSSIFSSEAIVIRMNAMDIDKYFMAGSVEEIVSRHFFEHLSHEQITILLYKLWKILVPSGKLQITVPDFYGIIEYFKKKHEEQKFETVDILHSRIFASEEESPHRSIWSAEIARHYLLRESFFTIEDIITTGAVDFELTIFAEKR